MTTTTDLPNWEFPDITDPAARTQARISIVKPLWDRGLSAGQIMYHFVGASRNAIIGLVHRNKWQRAKSVPHVTRRAAPNPHKPVKRPPGRPKIERTTIEPESEKVDWIHTERRPLAGTVPIRLIDLPSRAGVLCRFPVQGGYCGQPSGEAMYCDGHHRFMYSARPDDE